MGSVGERAQKTDGTPVREMQSPCSREVKLVAEFLRDFPCFLDSFVKLLMQTCSLT